MEVREKLCASSWYHFVFILYKVKFVRTLLKILLINLYFIINLLLLLVMVGNRDSNGVSFLNLDFHL